MPKLIISMLNPIKTLLQRLFRDTEAQTPLPHGLSLTIQVFQPNGIINLVEVPKEKVKNERNKEIRMG